MTDTRERQAYDRIEAALARIEAASAGGGAMGDLPERHARLREGAGAALARIDRMIESRKG